MVRKNDISLIDLKAHLAPGQRLMGLDLGSKTIGMALSDATLNVATPLGTAKRTKLTADLSVLFAAAQANDVGGFILGLPLNMDGSEGPRAQSTRAFAREMSRRSPLPVGFWDERLSTIAVTRTLLEADLSRKRRAQVVDKMAAAYILQGALDYLAQNGSERVK
jgi:putative Holliday junction resolvase